MVYVCAGNVFVNCDHGVLVLNSSDVHIYQNTFINSMAAIGRNTRGFEGDHFGWHPSTGPDVDERDGHIFVNNLMTGDESYDRPLLLTWQTPSLCEQLSEPLLEELDHNVYVYSNNETTYPQIQWSPATGSDCQAGFESLENLRKLYPQFSSNSREFKNYTGPLFKSPKLKNFQLLSSFPGLKSGVQLPAMISNLIGQKKKDGQYIGAYPPMP